MGDKMKIFILIFINIFFIYLLWFQKVEKTTISIGLFSFELKIVDDLKPLRQTINYIESHEKDESKTNLALKNLTNYYFKVTSKKNLVFVLAVLYSHFYPISALRHPLQPIS